MFSIPRTASDCRIQKFPNSRLQIAQPTTYWPCPSTGLIGDNQNGAALVRRDLRRFDIPFSTDGTPVVQALSPNAETQIKAFRDTIASDSATDELKSYDLVWLLHLIGDIHQPLHATSRFSHDLPEGDRGGNQVRLCKKPCRDELHAFWDDLLGNSKSPTAAIKAGKALSPAPAESDQDIHAWIEESFEAAKAYVYTPPIGPGRGPYKLTAEYKRVADKIGEERVAIAGARLARFLDDNLH